MARVTSTDAAEQLNLDGLIVTALLEMAVGPGLGDGLGVGLANAMNVKDVCASSRPGRHPVETQATQTSPF